MNDGLQEEYERERRIASLSVSLLAATTEEEFRRITLHEVAAAFGGVANILALVENGRLRTPPVSGTDLRFAQDMDGMLLTTPHPITDMIRSGEPSFITREEYAKGWPDFRHQVDWTSAKSALHIPFGAKDHPLGGWVVLHKDKERLTPNAQAMMRTLGYLAGQALERIRVQEARLELVRALQRSMLPPLSEKLPGLEVITRYAPAQDGLDVGGDWYDAFPLADGTVALVIGDVQGHDVDAATVMGQVRTSIRAFASLQGDPSIVLQNTNDLLVRMAVPHFASCTFMRYDPRAGTVQAARAGHIPPVCVYQDGSHGPLKIEGGPVLGVLPQAKYPALSFSLRPVALLALVTDGVVEGPRQPLEAGLEQLSSMAAQAVRESLDFGGIADRLLGAAETVGHKDDAAVLLVRPSANE
jgi:serine phosphatase RsbU (regulator of sigma subunit)